MPTPATRGRALGTWLARLTATAEPGVRGLGGALGRGGAAASRLVWRQRAALLAVAHRLMWWAALVLLVYGGQRVLGLAALPSRLETLAPFAIGLWLCGLLRLLAAGGHLRLAALGLGALHGLGALLVWTAFAA